MARVTVLLYGAYRQFAGGRKRTVVDASSIGEALDRAADAIPALRERLRDEQGRLREHTNIFANDEEIRRLDGERTPLRDGDLVHIIPAVSGGRGSR